MKLIYVLLLFILPPLLIGCCNCKTTSDLVGKDNTNQTTPTSIVQNLSIVTARIDDVIFKSETDYQLKVTVLTVEQNDSYSNIAVPGNEYLLTPNFRYDNDKLMSNEVNESLKTLGKLSKGKEFKAEISLENKNGWFIQKVLSY
jgi:hypothetical protein